MTGICTLSFLVPGLIYISIPGLSSLVTISILAVVLRASDFPFALILYAPTGSASSSATSCKRFFSIASIYMVSFPYYNINFVTSFLINMQV